MAFGLPISLDLKGRRAIVVGGGIVGERKTRTLLEAGANVTVISERFCAGLRELGKRGEITLMHRAYAPGDLEGAYLAVAATNSPHVNRRIYAEADESRVLLNAVDDPEHCHFAFPSVLRRGDVQVAVSTGGRVPALAKWMRRRLARSIGPEYADLAEILVQARDDAAGARRSQSRALWSRRWERALDEDLLGLIRRGHVEEAGALVRQRLTEAATDKPGNPATRPGKVAIVGAGPGDGGLMTLRGRHLLDEADVVVFDRLVSPDLVEGKHAVYVGKSPAQTGHHGETPGEPGTQTPALARGRQKGPSQAEVNMLLVIFARQGRNVVRLKGGDPFVFGRGAEEAEALAAEGIEFEIVPAPSSAIAALAYAGIPVTDRRYASSVAIVAGHTAGAREVNWSGLATSVDTIVVLMGTAVLGSIADRLVAAGCDPMTPAAVVENGTLPLQKVVTAPLHDLADAATRGGIGTPSVVVVGEVVRLRDRIRWFDKDPEASSPTILPGSAREGQPT